MKSIFFFRVCCPLRRGYLCSTSRAPTCATTATSRVNNKQCISITLLVCHPFFMLFCFSTLSARAFAPRFELDPPARALSLPIEFLRPAPVSSHTIPARIIYTALLPLPRSRTPIALPHLSSCGSLRRSLSYAIRSCELRLALSRLLACLPRLPILCVHRSLQLGSPH